MRVKQNVISIRLKENDDKERKLQNESSAWLNAAVLQAVIRNMQ